ncbi:MAG: type II secretion system secretin GspD [Pseudomonadota bacterium]
MFRTNGWTIGCLAVLGVLLLQTGQAQEKPATPPGVTDREGAVGVIDRNGKATRKFSPDKSLVRQKSGEAKEDPKETSKIMRVNPAGPGEAPKPGAPMGGPMGGPIPPGPGPLPGVVPPGAPGATLPGAAPLPGVAPAPTPDGIARNPTGDAIERNPTGVTSIPCVRLPLDSMVNLDFKEVPIDDLIRLMSCWTGKNFLLTQGFAGKNVTLMSPQQVTVAQAYRAFLSALRAHALTVVPAGAFMKIVPDTQAKQEPIRLLKKVSGVPDADEIVTKIIELQHVPASEITQVLDQFKGKTGEIVAYGEDLLIVTDTGTMIRRLMRLLTELDIPTDKEKIWVRQVEYAEAGEVVNIITGIFPQAGDSAAKKAAPAARQRPQRGRKSPAPAAAAAAKIIGGEAEPIAVSKVIADERTNQIIVVCNRTTYMRLDKLLRKVDVPIPGEGQIHIVYLENADAEDVSSTLSSLTSGTGRAAGGRPTAAKTTGAKGAGGAAGGGSAALFEGEVKITADAGTNALVVEASLKDFRSLKKVIDKLDIRRKQVYVEAIIMEISSNKDRKFGMSGSGGTTFNAQGETVPMLFGLGGLGISGFDAQQLMGGGLAVGLQGPLVDVSTGSAGDGAGVGDLSIPAFGFLLQAIQKNSDVNILSTPHILTTDNEEAEIQVGKQIPYRASSMGGLGGLSSMAGLAGLGGSSSGLGSALGGMGGLGGLMGGLGGGMVQRIDVDLTLKITPHVNESNFVKLEIDQSIEDVESIDRELGPTTSKRKVKNVVVVRDQQPVVIGGLIRDTESEGVDKIPLLGDIPLVGILFRQTVRTVEKKNLLMIIVPHIIDDPSDLSRIHRERMEEIRRFAEYLATKEKEHKGMVDYRKKSGGLETMRQVVDRARTDRSERERARFEGTAIDVVGPPDTHDLDYDPEQLEKPGEKQKGPDKDTE